MTIVWRMVLRALAVLVVAGSAGCGVGSIAPVVSKADVRFDPRLLGTWQESSGKEFVVITAAGRDRYELLYTDSEGKAGRFWGVLGQVKSSRVLDLEPADPAPGTNDLYRSLLLPLHGVVFIDSVGADLHIRLLNPDSLTALLRADPKSVAHAFRDDAVVLTAPTGEVQSFLAAAVRRRGVLENASVWVRRAP